MRKVFGLFMFLAIVLALGAIPAKASPNHAIVIVPIFQGPGEVTVFKGDILVFRYDWSAMNSGHVRAFLHQSKTSFTLSNAEGVVVRAVGPKEAADYWDLIRPGPDLPECRGDDEAKTQWNFPVIGLAPGNYVFDFSLTHHAQITDGCDRDGDGHLDFYGETNRQIVIHVVPK